MRVIFEEHRLLQLHLCFMFSLVRVKVAINGKFIVMQRSRLIGASDPYPEIHIWCECADFVKAHWWN